jgi:hypothetical protein
MTTDNIAMHTCEHSWDHIDDSFDHEFGTQKDECWVCEFCSDVRFTAPPEPIDEQGDYDYEP